MCCAYGLREHEDGTEIDTPSGRGNDHEPMALACRREIDSPGVLDINIEIPSNASTYSRPFPDQCHVPSGS